MAPHITVTSKSFSATHFAGERVFTANLIKKRQSLHVTASAVCAVPYQSFFRGYPCQWYYWYFVQGIFWKFAAMNYLFLTWTSKKCSTSSGCPTPSCSPPPFCLPSDYASQSADETHNNTRYIRSIRTLYSIALILQKIPWMVSKMWKLPGRIRALLLIFVLSRQFIQYTLIVKHANGTCRGLSFCWKSTPTWGLRNHSSWSLRKPTLNVTNRMLVGSMSRLVLWYKHVMFSREVSCSKAFTLRIDGVTLDASGTTPIMQASRYKQTMIPGIGIKDGDNKIRIGSI